MIFFFVKIKKRMAVICQEGFLGYKIYEVLIAIFIVKRKVAVNLHLNVIKLNANY